MRSLRAAVIGVGNFGRKHALIYNSLADVELVGVADSNPDRAVEMAKALGVPWYADFHDLLARTRPDVVSVVTPAEQHRDPTLAALDAGAHVMVEKPIASTLADADQMISRAEDSGRILLVGHLLRFDYAFKELAERVRSGKLGEIGFIYPRRNLTANLMGAYASAPRILTTLSHDINVICWMLDKLPLSVAATAKSFSGSGNDLYLATLDFGQAVASLESCWFLPSGYPSSGDARFEVVGTKGMAVIKWPSDVLAFHTDDRTDLADVTAWPEGQDWIGGVLLRELRSFVDCVLSGTTIPDLRVSEARLALEIALAIGEAAELRQTIPFRSSHR